MNNNNGKLTKRQRLEERVKFFLSNKNQIFPSQRYFDNNYETIDEEQKYISTIKIYKKSKSNQEINGKKINIVNILKNEETINRVTSIITVNKSIAKFVEPRFKIKEFQKLAPKFLKSNEISCTVSQILNQDTHEIEMLEIDEKLPQEKLNQIEERRNKINIYQNFPFNFFFRARKMLSRIIQRFKK